MADTADPAEPADPMRWVWRAGALLTVVLGWLFILWTNKFHTTAPVIIVCLAYFAVVATVFNLWRTGAVVASVEEDEADSTWSRSLGARGELEREKKSLLKAIKEAEFDREMNKLSQQDAEEMIAIYRNRAIEVIKELDKLDGGAAGTVREQIDREVKARLEVEAKTKKSEPAVKTEPAVKPDAAAKDSKKKGKKGKASSTPGAPVDAIAGDAEDQVATAAATGDATAGSDAKANDVKASDVTAAAKTSDATADAKVADVTASDAAASDATAGKGDTNGNAEAVVAAAILAAGEAAALAVAAANAAVAAAAKAVAARDKSSPEEAALAKAAATKALADAEAALAKARAQVDDHDSKPNAKEATT